MFFVIYKIYPRNNNGFNLSSSKICFKSSALTVTSPEIPPAIVSSLGAGAANAKAKKKQTRKICWKWKLFYKNFGFWQLWTYGNKFHVDFCKLLLFLTIFEVNWWISRSDRRLYSDHKNPSFFHRQTGYALTKILHKKTQKKVCFVKNSEKLEFYWQHERIRTLTGRKDE